MNITVADMPLSKLCHIILSLPFPSWFTQGLFVILSIDYSLTTQDCDGPTEGKTNTWGGLLQLLAFWVSIRQGKLNGCPFAWGMVLLQ